jgi:AcrR family transcriptional regulator
VATEYTGTGDPVRSMELLWSSDDGAVPKRGPRPKLRMADVVRKAIDLADHSGLAALSMRKLADELGVTAMSLYTYVPGKGELLDLMTDAVCAETARPEPGNRSWRDRLTQIAHENWALYRRHPWLLQVATNRPVLGPNLIAKYDYELRAVEGLGLTDVEMDMTIALLADFVHGSVRAALNQAQAKAHTGMTELEWWEKFQPLLAKVFDADRFPTATRVGAAAGEEFQAAAAPERTFAFGLERLLDGVEALVHTRS